MPRDVVREPFLLQRMTKMPPLVKRNTRYDAEHALTVCETKDGVVPYVKTREGAMSAKTFVRDVRPGED